MDTELLLSLNYKVSSHFRLLAADKSWFERIKQKEEISQTRKERSKSRKIALVMKNNGVLYALDDDEAGMVRRIEYSNSLLLAQHSRSPISQLSVVGTLNAMYEVQSSPAENNALFCLRSSYLTLDELNGKANPNSNLWNFSELVLLSQSTPKQLSDILISEGAVIHQGKSNEIIGGSTAFWDLAKLQLSSIPSLAIDVVRSLFSSDKAVQSSTISLFDHRKTVVSIGKYVFLSNSESLKREVSSVQTMGLPSESFLEEWVKCIPSSFFNVESFPDRTDVKGLFALLSGCIVQTTRDSTSWVWWVPSDSLPRSIEARLSILFSIKDEMWDGVDLQAYIEPILAADQSFPHAIQRFTLDLFSMPLSIHPSDLVDVKVRSLRGEIFDLQVPSSCSIGELRKFFIEGYQYSPNTIILHKGTAVNDSQLVSKFPYDTLQLNPFPNSSRYTSKSVHDSSPVERAETFANSGPDQSPQGVRRPPPGTSTDSRKNENEKIPVMSSRPFSKRQDTQAARQSPFQRTYESTKPMNSMGVDNKQKTEAVTTNSAQKPAVESKISATENKKTDNQFPRQSPFHRTYESTKQAEPLKATAAQKPAEEQKTSGTENKKMDNYYAPRQSPFQRTYEPTKPMNSTATDTKQKTEPVATSSTPKPAAESKTSATETKKTDSKTPFQRIHEITKQAEPVPATAAQKPAEVSKSSDTNDTKTDNQPPRKTSFQKTYETSKQAEPVPATTAQKPAEESKSSDTNDTKTDNQPPRKTSLQKTYETTKQAEPVPASVAQKPAEDSKILGTEKKKLDNQQSHQTPETKSRRASSTSSFNQTSEQEKQSHSSEKSIVLTCRIPDLSSTCAVSVNASASVQDVVTELIKQTPSLNNSIKVLRNGKLLQVSPNNKLFDLGIRDSCTVFIASGNFSNPETIILVEVEESVKSIAERIDAGSSDAEKRGFYEVLMRMLFSLDGLQTLEGDWRVRRKAAVKNITALQDRLHVD